ncbi:MAG: hypothetical protein JNM10_00165 [Planctomycetia bacterium]|nr:hypothetical protein [Planctomycetia bacterium]
MVLRARSPRGEYLQFPRSAWEALTARQRQVLQHRIAGGLTLESTASVLAITVSVVRKTQRAALRRLERNAAALREAISAQQARVVRPTSRLGTGDTSSATE